MWTLEGISRDHCTNRIGRAVSEGRSVGEDGVADFLARFFNILHLCKQELRRTTNRYPDSSTATRESQPGEARLRWGGLAVDPRPPNAIDPGTLVRIRRSGGAGEHWFIAALEGNTTARAVFFRENRAPVGGPRGTAFLNRDRGPCRWSLC